MIGHDLFPEVWIRLHPHKVINVWKYRAYDAIIIRHVLELWTGDLRHKRLCRGRVMRLELV